MTKKIIYYASIAASVILLILGYLYVSGGKNPFGPDVEHESYTRAKVLEVTDVVETQLDDDGDFIDTTYYFTVLLTSGENKGETLTVTQDISNYIPYNPRPVSTGDKVIITQSIIGDETSWNFAEYVRSDTIIVLGILFCIALVVFGKIKGLKTLFTLILTIGAVFFVLVPAIITGHNIYVFTILVCLYITAMTLVTVNGLSDMSLVAGLGCMGGVLISAVITLLSDIFMKLTGFTDEHAIYIQGIGDGNIDMKALIFAGILVGSIGAVMDVAVDIAASLKEICRKVEKPTFRELYKSGITISRDVIGTMSNTLILAYIGSSLCSVLLIIYNNSFSMLNLFNKENIITEILKILVGSFGILSALPLTSAISAFFYSRRHGKDNETPTEEKDDYVELLESIENDKK